jgi:acyl-CoA reductase-like NAD-dependent aldehyde dehydrogenase
MGETMNTLATMLIRQAESASIKAAEAIPGWRKTLLEQVADELKKAAEEVRSGK